MRVLSNQLFATLAFALTLPVFGKTSSVFVRNEGQWPEACYFRSQIGSNFIWLGKGKIYYQLRRADLHPIAQEHTRRFGGKPDTSRKLGHNYNVNFRGCNPVIPRGSQDAGKTKYHFFTGNARNWRTNVSAYPEIQYESLYPGVDLKIRTGDAFLKYDFELEAGNSGEKIVMEFEGTEGLSLHSGRLRIKTAIGTIEEHIPKAYQLINGSAREISCRYVLSGNQVRFRFDKTPDPKFPTVIDPLLIFYTYSGALDDNWANTAVSDGRGNSYTAGTIYGSSFPTTTGAIDRSYNGQNNIDAYLTYDIGLLKFDSSGSQLLYCTFLGGSGADTPHSLAIDAFDNLYILGSTSSPNFPVTANAFQQSFRGGPIEYPFGIENGAILPTYLNGSDLFISRISREGDNLLSSTFLGGTGNDGILTVYESLVTNYGDQFRSDILCAPDGSVYIASHTHSADFPVINAFQGFRAGPIDGIAARLSGNLGNLLWATYFGGNGEDAFYSLKLLKENKVAFCGGSTSTNLPVSPNASQTGLSGDIDGIIAVFNAQTGSYQHATYSGTPSYDQVFLLEGDEEGNVYILGQTKGIMPNNTPFGQNEGGNFLQKYNSQLSSRLWACTFGTTKRQPNIVPTGLMLDSCERIFIAGWGGAVNYSGNGFTGGYTTGLPVSDDALQPVSGDQSDFYFLVLGKNASNLVYGSYMGADTRRGEHVDGGTSRFDRNGVITQAICGCRDEQGDYLRGSINAYERDILSQNCNNGVLKFNLLNLVADMEWAGTLKCPATLTLTNNSQNGLTYIWDMGNGDTIVSNQRIVEYTYRNPGKYWLSIKAINPKTCRLVSIDGDSILIPDPFPFPEFSKVDTFCAGDTLRPVFQEIASYPIWWTPQSFLSNPATFAPTIVPLGSIQYTIRIRNQDSCYREIPYRLVNRKLQLGIGMEKEFRPCESITNVRFFSNKDSSDFYLWDFGNGETFTGPEITRTFVGNGVFPVRLSGGLGECLENAFDSVKVKNPKVNILPAFSSEQLFRDCTRPEVFLKNRTLNASGFEWDFGDGNKSTETDPVHNYSEPGTYRIILKAFKDGCIEAVSKEVNIVDLFVPNLITVNKDELNDTLQIKGLQPGWGLDVFNRWGKPVFSASDYQNNWIPEKLEEGVYFYSIRFPAGGHCRSWFQIIRNSP